MLHMTFMKRQPRSHVPSGSNRSFFVSLFMCTEALGGFFCCHWKTRQRGLDGFVSGDNRTSGTGGPLTCFLLGFATNGCGSIVFPCFQGFFLVVSPTSLGSIPNNPHPIYSLGYKPFRNSGSPSFVSSHFLSLQNGDELQGIYKSYIGQDEKKTVTFECRLFFRGFQYGEGRSGHLVGGGGWESRFFSFSVIGLENNKMHTKRGAREAASKNMEKRIADNIQVMRLQQKDLGIVPCGCRGLGESTTRQDCSHSIAICTTGIPRASPWTDFHSINILFFYLPSRFTNKERGHARGWTMGILRETNIGAQRPTCRRLGGTLLGSRTQRVAYPFEPKQ